MQISPNHFCRDLTVTRPGCAFSDPSGGTKFGPALRNRFFRANLKFFSFRIVESGVKRFCLDYYSSCVMSSGLFLIVASTKLLDWSINLMERSFSVSKFTFHSEMEENDENEFRQYADSDFEDEERREILDIGEETDEDDDAEPPNEGLIFVEESEVLG